jgi:hypothetical protein
VSLALARLYSVVHPATHHPLANVNHLSDTVINDQILLRVNKDPGVQAECTPEGDWAEGPAHFGRCIHIRSELYTSGALHMRRY